MNKELKCTCKDTPHKKTCCEKCYSTYTEHDYPFHTVYDACINQNCDCHLQESKEECQCACHENKLKQLYAHDVECCKNMNGFIPQESKEELTINKWDILTFPTPEEDITPTQEPTTEQCLEAIKTLKRSVRVENEEPMEWGETLKIGEIITKEKSDKLMAVVNSLIKQAEERGYDKGYKQAREDFY